MGQSFKDKRGLLFILILAEFFLMVYLANDSLAARILQGYRLPTSIILLVAVFVTFLTIWTLLQIERLQKEFNRLDRLNLVGQMAAGIGHEIRNPITVVRGFLQMLQKQEDRYQKEFELMIKELDRANIIISEYLSLARDKLTKPKCQSLNAVIGEISPLLDAQAAEMGHEISYCLGEIPGVLVDDKEIRQMLFNLVSNGLQAMQGDGTLFIRTISVNGFVFLDVEDQGTGMDADVIEKIGTPFFTTKEGGTGLGLPVCYSIAERHNAKISFKTDDTGTVFSVRFKAEEAPLIWDEMREAEPGRERESV